MSKDTLTLTTNGSLASGSLSDFLVADGNYALQSGVRHGSIPEEIQINVINDKPADILIRIPFKDHHNNDNALLLTETEAYKLYEVLSEVLKLK